MRRSCGNLELGRLWKQVEQKKKIVIRVGEEKMKLRDRKEWERRELKGRRTHLSDSNSTLFIIPPANL